jgi:hypothetical protein
MHHAIGHNDVETWLLARLITVELRMDEQSGTILCKGVRCKFHKKYLGHHSIGPLICNELTGKVV